MITDLKKIRNSGKTEESFYLEYVPEEGLTDIPNVSVTKIKANGTVFLDGEHSAFIEGEAEFFLDGECTRCLSRTERGYISTFSEHAGEGEGSYPVINDKVDLKRIIEDCVIINMPVSFLCKEDCKGLCLTCGANLNEGDCKCEKKGW